MWSQALCAMVFVPAQKLSSIAWTPIRYVTLHFRDQRGATSLRYRNRAKIWTAFVCEQKPYALWFSCRRGSYAVWCKNSRTLFCKPLAITLLSQACTFTRREQQKPAVVDPGEGPGRLPTPLTFGRKSRAHGGGKGSTSLFIWQFCFKAAPLPLPYPWLVVFFQI